MYFNEGVLIPVRLSGPNNSTMFTACCDVAICDDEWKCPRCKREVYPGKDHNEQERRKWRWEQAYGPFRRT
jgi:hypothetical protein